MVHLTIVNNFDYLKKIVDLVEIICSFLKEKIQKILLLLEALGNLLAYGKKNSVNEENEIVKRIVNCGGENDLEQLQFHSVGMIYEKALFILEKYFDT